MAQGHVRGLELGTGGPHWCSLDLRYTAGTLFQRRAGPALVSSPGSNGSEAFVLLFGGSDFSDLWILTGTESGSSHFIMQLTESGREVRSSQYPNPVGAVILPVCPAAESLYLCTCLSLLSHSCPQIALALLLLFMVVAFFAKYFPENVRHAFYHTRLARPPKVPIYYFITVNV